ncbi:MAG: NAD(P)-dependent alcohol dehydrogenase [Rhodothermales bacterium]
MKAIVYSAYGSPDVLRIQDVPTPTPADNEVLVRIHATTVTAGDRRARSLDLPAGFGLVGRLIFGVTKPRQSILGTELSGVVEAVGERVTRFKPGDAVFAFSGAGMGAYAEYRTLAEDGPIAPKPANLSFDEAAALSFGGATMLHFYKKAVLKAGDRVLVVGASGGVGTAAVQLAKHAGAHVTGVTSGRNADLVRSLGADEVIDYTKEDFSKNGKTYDVIVDTVGTAPYPVSKGSLAPGGRLLLIMSELPGMLSAPWYSMTTDKTVIAGPAAEKPEYIAQLAELAEAGAYRAVIDRTYSMEDAAEAHRYVDTGRKRGSVVIEIAQPEDADAARADARSHGA